MTSPLVLTWKQNVNINALLLNSLSKEGLVAQYTAKTRTVASQFAHMHNVRVSHVQRRSYRDPPALEAFPRGAQPTKRELQAALKTSDEAVATLLLECEGEGRVRSWKGPPTSYLGYFLAHEAHHRGLAMVSLRFAGVKIPKTVSYGLWDRWRKEP